MDSKEERRILARLAKTREEVTNFNFWRFAQYEREKVMSDLKYIQTLSHYHKYSEEATDLLTVINDHIDEVVTFHPSSRVVLLVKQNDIPAGSVGEVIITTAVAAEVKFDNDSKPATINKYLFRLERKIESKTVSASQPTELVESSADSPDLVVEKQEPVAANASIDQSAPKKPRGRPPLSDEEKAKRALEKDSKKKRGQKSKQKASESVAIKRKYTKHTKPDVEQPAELLDGQQNSVVTASESDMKGTEPIEDQSPFVPTSPILDVVDGSTVVEPPVVANSTDKSFVYAAAENYIQNIIESQRGLPDVPESVHQEEVFPIRDVNVFEPGFLFAKIEHGKRNIYAVTSAYNAAPDGKNSRRMLCRKLDPETKIWDCRKQQLDYKLPTFLKPTDFSYLTPREYQLVYGHCLVGLPLNHQSVNEVCAFQTMLQQSALDQLLQYVQNHPGFSSNRDALFFLADFAKQRIQNEQVFSSIVRLIANDDNQNMVGKLGLFAAYLEEQEHNPDVVRMIDAVIAEKNRENRAQRVAHDIAELANRLNNQNLSKTELQSLENQLRQLKEVAK